MDSTTAEFHIYETVPCDGGVIKYYMKDVNAFFIFHNVKQVKGKGVADADYLTDLNNYHKEILDVMVMSGWEKMTGEQIRGFIKNRIQLHTSSFTMFKEANWIRPISELFRRGLLVKDDLNPPHYSIRQPKVEKALETGKF